MNEELSRLMDGDLSDADVERVVSACRRDDTMTAWACWHLIGDALRGQQVSPGHLSERVARALASEPTVLAPQRRAARPLVSWAFAAAATLAAIGVVGWTAFSLTQTPGTAIAKAREASSVTAAQVRPHALPQEYVLVHQEHSPATAIQGMRPYLRAVSAPAGESR